MINNSIQNTIDQHMKTLPSYVQSAIHSSDWERRILNIGRKYGLHVDQLEILQTELSLAVLGLSDRQEFVHEVMREARVNKETMDLIVGEINRDIFIPIRKALREAQEDFEAEQDRVELDETEDSEPTSLSGLEKNEEDLLKTHGVSFGNDDDDEVVEKKRDSQPIEHSAPEEPQPEIAKPRLIEPLRLNNQVSQTTKEVKNNDVSSLSSILGSMSLKPSQQTEQKKENQKVAQEQENENVVEVEQGKIPGEEIDISKLAGSKTSEHQTIINNASSSGYTKQDPYREPVK